MKQFLSFLLVAFLIMPTVLISQDEAISPTVIKTPVAFEITEPLRDNPIVSETEFANVEFIMNAHRDRVLNPDILPPNFDKMPADPGEQTKAGWIEGAKATLMNFAGQNSGSYPPDCNGSVGHNYYFQVVNTTYTIYNKSTGAVVTGPSPLNSIFNSTLPGAGCNNGDPIVLWDEHANRWFYAEFSLCSSTDYMLIAVSQTSNPTGSWYSWSYDVDDMPDYMKFGIWQDGYYMATNTSPGNDVYVFDRTAMIAGNANPTMIGFDNSWRPSTFDGFHCILPLDNDGPWAPTNTPGQFITIADGGQGNPADQLWIYELIPNWTTPSSSTFNRVQQIGVNSFSGNFTGDWNNIPQQGTTQTLDGLSTILMFRAQYRNFNGTERLVCAHAIAESSSEASMRWYELENTGTTWSIRQQATYNPDNISRWNMSIAMNGSKEIGIGYSVSNASMYPGIRYIGQSAAANAAANNTLDMAETNLWTGSNYQSTYNRWGDYANISIDPSDDHTFWFTTEYVASSTHGSRIASFQLSSASSPPVADFAANITMPPNTLTTVNFTDMSTGSPTSWLWSFSPSNVTYFGGTSSTSQNPSVRFNSNGAYTVTLTATNANGSDAEVKTDYIHVGQPGLWVGGATTNQTDWNTAENWNNHMVPVSTTDVSIIATASYWPEKTGNLTIGTDCNSVNFGLGGTELSVSGDLTINSGHQLYVDPTGYPEINIGGDWNNNGTFATGMETIRFTGSTNSVINTPTGGPVYLINEDFASGLGNWNGDIGTGNGQYTTATTSNAGGASPEARFTWMSGTDTKRLYHSSINTTGLTSLTLDFTHSVNDYSGSAYTISVEYSTDGTTWNNAGWSLTPTGNVSATPVSLTLTSSQGVGSSNLYIAFVITGNLYNINYWYIDDVQAYYNASGLDTFFDLINNKSGALVSTNGNINVVNDFTIVPNAYFTNNVGSQLSVSGTTLFMAYTTGMASFIDNGASTFITDPYVQQFLTPDQWHYVGVPVNGAQSGVYYNIYLRTFNEPNDSWDPYIYQTGVALDPPMTGYAAWAPGSPFFVQFNGSLHDGPYNIPVTAQSSGSNAGWNLVSNPYPSSLDWDGPGWTKSAISNTIYYYSGVSGLSNYHYYVGSGSAPYTGVALNDGTNEIPPHQGFFVHATTNGTLGVNNSARIHSGQTYYKDNGKVEVPMIRIEAKGLGLNDETVIRFVPESNAEFDPDFDAYKLFVETYPQVYTVSPAGTELAVSSLPEITPELVIPLSLKVPETNTYSLHFNELVGINSPQELYLEDLQANEINKVDLGMVYSFEHSPDYNTDRFLLHFSNPMGVESHNTPEISIYAYQNVVYVNKPQDFSGTITINDVLGKEILSLKSDGGGLVNIPVNSGNGYYIVKVISEEIIKTEKVYIK